MHDEAGFLSAIRQTPADDTARLVFADWLDEQDDPACKTKAAFIRLELRMAEAPATVPDLAKSDALRSLAASIPNEWLAVVSRPKLDTYPSGARFVCPGKWELLSPTALDDRRRCEQCKGVALFCETTAAAQFWRSRGLCVAVSPAAERRPGDLCLPYPAVPPHSFLLRPAEPPAVPPSPPQLPPPIQGWLPAQPARVNRLRQKLRRKKDRTQNRNLQRENWEEPE